MRLFVVLAFLALSTWPAFAQSRETDPAVDAAVLEVYGAFSFEAGTRPDVEAIRSLFTPVAQLSFVRDDTLVSKSIDAYLAGWAEGVAGLESLDEREIGGRTEQFGDVAHRMSAYAVAVNGAEVERGVILYQLVRVGGRWLIQAMAWDSESEGLALPPELTGE